MTPGTDPSRAPEPTGRGPWSRRPRVIAGAAVGCLAFGVLLGVLVVRYTAPAPPDPMAGMPGMSGTSGIAGMPGMAEAPGPSASPPDSAGGGRLAAIPTETLDGMLRAAHASLDAGRYQEAITSYRAVLKREPANVDAITHLGVILAVAGHADEALAAFDRALAINPDDLHALWEKARALQDLRQDFAGAIAVWERVVALTPPGQDRDQAEARIRDARARLAAAPQPAPPAPGRSDPGSTPSGSAPTGPPPRRSAP